MARLLTCGFEGGSLAADENLSGFFDSGLGGTTYAYSTTTVRSGARSLQLGGGGSQNLGLSAGSVLTNTYYQRLAIYPTTRDASDWYVIQIADGSTGLQFTVKPTGAMEVENYSSNAAVLTGVGTLALNTWTVIECSYVPATGATVVRVNGTQVVSGTIETTTNAVCYIANMFGSGVAFVDDWAINDSTGASNNSWPGLGRTGPIAEVSLAAGGAPSARTAHSLVFRGRTQTPATVTLQLALMEGATNRSGTLTSAPLTTTVAQYVVPIPDAVAASIASYSDLSVRMWGSSDAPVVIEVEQLFLQAPPVGGPQALTASATAATAASAAVIAPSTAYRNAILAEPGLVSYWRLGETSGNVLDSKDSNPGTTVTSITRNVPGLIVNSGDGAASTDGTTGPYVRVPYSANMDTGAELSVEFWIKPTALDASSLIYPIGRDNPSTTIWFVRYYASGDGRWEVDVVDANSVTTVLTSKTGTEAAAAGKLQHIVATYSATAGQLRLFINGVSTTSTQNRTPNANVLAASSVIDLFSGWSHTSTPSMNGVLDEVAVYNAALTPSQIANHYVLGTGIPYLAASASGASQATALVAVLAPVLATATSTTIAAAALTAAARITAAAVTPSAALAVISAPTSLAASAATPTAATAAVLAQGQLSASASTATSAQAAVTAATVAPAALTATAAASSSAVASVAALAVLTATAQGASAAVTAARAASQLASVAAASTAAQALTTASAKLTTSAQATGSVTATMLVPGVALLTATAQAATSASGFTTAAAQLGGAAITYDAAIAPDGPIHAYPTNESGGSVSSDSVAGDNASWTGTFTLAQAGPPGIGNAAVAVTGATAQTSVGELSIDTLSEEVWFKVANAYAAGGGLIQFADVTGTTAYDRQVWMGNDGKIYFGFWQSAGAITIGSPGAYNDGLWHHAVATHLSGGNCNLYVDGVLVAGPAAATAAGAGYTGYWKFANAYLLTWAPLPTNASITGAVAKMAIYNSALSAARVVAHYNAGVTAGVGGIAVQATTSAQATVTAAAVTPAAITATAGAAAAASATTTAPARPTATAQAPTAATLTVLTAQVVSATAQASAQATTTLTAAARITASAQAIAAAAANTTVAAILTVPAQTATQATASSTAQAALAAAAAAATAASITLTVPGVAFLTSTAAAATAATMVVSAAAGLTPTASTAAQAVALVTARATVVNNAEGGGVGVTVTIGNSGGASGNAPDVVDIGTGAALTFDNTHVAHGRLAYKFSTGATAALSRLQWNVSMGLQAKAWFRTYVWVDAWPAATIRLINMDQGTTACCVVVLLSSGKMQVRTGSAGTQTITTTNTVPTGAWFRIEGFCIGDPALGQVELKLFTDPDSPTPLETQTSAANVNTFGLMDHFNVGVSTTTANVAAYWEDDVGFSNVAYLGPPMQASAGAATAAVAAVSTGAPLAASAANQAAAVTTVTTTSPLTASAAAVSQAIALLASGGAQLAPAASATTVAVAAVTAAATLPAVASAASAAIAAVIAAPSLAVSAQTVTAASGFTTAPVSLSTAAALAVTSLTSSNAAATTVATTASVSPTANSLLVLWIAHAVSGGTTATPSGLGLTWTLAQRLVVASSTKIECWTAVCGASPGSGAITITLGAAATVCWDVDQVTGENVSAPLVTANTKTASGTGTAAALTYNAPTATDGLLYGCGASGFVSQTPNTAAGWTELADRSQATPSISLETQLSLPPASTAGASTLSASVNWGVIGIELAAAVGIGPSATTATSATATVTTALVPLLAPAAAAVTSVTASVTAAAPMQASASAATQAQTAATAATQLIATAQTRTQATAGLITGEALVATAQAVTSCTTGMQVPGVAFLTVTAAGVTAASATATAAARLAAATSSATQALATLSTPAFLSPAATTTSAATSAVSAAPALAPAAQALTQAAVSATTPIRLSVSASAATLAVALLGAGTGLAPSASTATQAIALVACPSSLTLSATVRFAATASTSAASTLQAAATSTTTTACTLGYRPWLSPAAAAASSAGLIVSVRVSLRANATSQTLAQLVVTAPLLAALKLPFYADVFSNRTFADVADVRAYVDVVQPRAYADVADLFTYADVERARTLVDVES
jgi:hypothetical protein